MNRELLKSLMGWTIVALTAILILGSSASQAYSAEGCCGGGTPDPKVLLRHTMHKLWAERGLWMRSYLIGSVAGMPDSSEAASRVLRNAEDMGNAVAPFMGMESANRLAQLLKAHTLTLFDAIEAAVSGDKGKSAAAGKKYGESAMKIATFLSKANPHWREPNLIDAWERNLALTLTEISARQQKNWTEDVIAADRNLDVMMTMAEGFAEGIIMQYPAKFPAKF